MIILMIFCPGWIKEIALGKLSRQDRGLSTGLYFHNDNDKYDDFYNVFTMTMTMINVMIFTMFSS